MYHSSLCLFSANIVILFVGDFRFTDLGTTAKANVKRIIIVYNQHGESSTTVHGDAPVRGIVSSSSSSLGSVRGGGGISGRAG